jgi:hypothetical protein
VDLGVGEARVVIDDGVDVVETEAKTISGAGTASVCAPAAVGDAAEFLHVNVD